MISAHGTDGISHEIHVATEEDDGVLSDFRKFENVLDVMNLPDGTVKFYYEGEQKELTNGKIVRSSVRGLDNSVRYRCSECQVKSSDLIGQERGESPSMQCPVCEKETEFMKLEINDI